jgi:hypothetical protein
LVLKLLAFDISGNFKEGKGTTGICIMLNGEVWKLDTIKAKDYETVEKYWAAHEDYIMREFPDHMVMEGYKLYNHKGMSAKTQANSDLETPQMLGFLKMVCYRLDIPYTIQYATEVKARWQESILVHLNILQQKGSKYYWNGQPTVTHTRDSLKHALHFSRYKESKI